MSNDLKVGLIIAVIIGFAGFTFGIAIGKDQSRNTSITTCMQEHGDRPYAEISKYCKETVERWAHTPRDLQ